MNVIEVRKYFQISESYPPNSRNNGVYTAQVHEALKEIDLSLIDQQEDIIWRLLQTENDVSQLEELHEEWFPLHYGKKFYSKLLTNQQKPLVIEIDLKRFGGKKYIIGALIYEKRIAKGSELRFVCSNICKDTYCYYIQTIGVINEFRMCGYASFLINHLKNKALQSKEVKCISLHMVTYNSSGERFYLKNGFSIIKRCQEFYYIDNSFYDSFLFIHYLNGGMPPLKLFSHITAFFKSITNKCKVFFSHNYFAQDHENQNDYDDETKII